MVRIAQDAEGHIAGIVQNGKTSVCLSRWKVFIYVEGHRGENIQEP